MSVRSLIRRLFQAEPQALEDQQTNEARVGLMKREFAEHPSKGLTPARLYQILEEAEQGDLKAQHELFEDMEEKDPQIGADLGKRRQLAAELEWQIVPPDNATAAEKKAAEHAAEVFSGIEVEDLILDMGVAIGHGWSNLELTWAMDGQLRYIEQPELRPHSWFRLHPDEQNTITLRDMSHTGAELWPLGWVQHRHRARPGYVARSGLHRILAWPYLFQSYALGDLARFLEIYGLPARLGKYQKNASDKEKATLLRAVLSLGSNAAGIIPEGMAIEFLTAAEGRSDVFGAMLQWCERSKAKAILGGTLTSGTGEGTNTNALGNVHERSLESLIRSDARQYAGTIRRDILWPMAAMNFGIEKMRRAPRFFLEVREGTDLSMLAEVLPRLLEIGFEIPHWWGHEKSGIPVAQQGEKLLQAPAAPTSPFGAFRQRQRPHVAALRELPKLPGDASEEQLGRLQADADRQIEQWVNEIRAVVDQAQSLEDLRDRLVELMPNLPPEQFADAMTDALAAAHLAGRYDILEGL